MSVLDGRTAIITGAGRGIGREHALLFASLGAAVVVNDFEPGVELGAGTSVAESVVEEITAAGGTAIASLADISTFAGAQSTMDAALNAFGDLDIVVNNAGIIRDSALVNMTEQDFDDVVAVNLKGTFAMSRTAAVHWRAAAKAGTRRQRAIVNTASGSGLHGIPGQANYSAAKAGVAAMTLVSSKELDRYGVHVNCIAPIARTRLTDGTPRLAARMAEPRFDAANISPLVAYLASERCVFNGQVFAVHGGAVGIYCGWSMTQEVRTDGRWDVDSLALALEGDFPRALVGRSSGALDADAAS